MNRTPPAWMAKAREFWARTPSPVGAPFLAKANGKEADLYLYDFIGKDDWTGGGIDARDVLSALEEARGASQLNVHINSPGGSVFDGIAIYNAIRSFKGAKTVYVDGVAASIASVIALAGEKVITSHGAQWMVHDPAGGMVVFGTADDIENEARKMTAALRKVRENLVGIYVDNTGRSLSEVSAWMTAETWMTADEALERGLTDEVERPDPVAQSQARSVGPSAQIRERTLSNLRNAASRAATPASRDNKASK